jgi:two-component system heavy metal sensor histidine kinase CusS
MKRLASMSIAMRLSLLFAIVAVLTFATVGVYLYGSLAQKMSHRDDTELLTRVELVRQFLKDAPSSDAFTHSPHPLLDAVFGNVGCILRVTRGDGSVILQTQSALPPRPLPNSAWIPVGRQANLGDLRDWEAAVGMGRMVRAVGQLGDGSEAFITIARERSDRTALLAKYARDLATAVILGGALVSALGFLAIRQAMQSLHAVIEKANDISTHRLNSRLEVESTPSEVRELGRAFNSMLERLEEGVQRLSGFAADLAHDLRTPINTLMVQTQVALGQLRSPEEYRGLLGSNIEEYERLARMIENTLFLARVDNPQFAVNREMLDAAAELQRIRDYFEGVAEDAGIALHVCVDKVSINADPILFRRAVNNLVSNAIRYTPRGGVVRLSANRPSQFAEVMVENTGPGIAAEHIPYIFDRYYRGDPARSDAGHSVGLGLSIVRAIMHLHNGEILAQSTPGDKTSFCLRFSTM